MVKNPCANAGDVRDMGLIPGSGRSPGEGNGNPLQYCLGNLMDRGAWWAIVHWGCKKSDTTEQLTVSHKRKEINGLQWMMMLIGKGKEGMTANEYGIFGGRGDENVPKNNCADGYTTF